MSSGFDKNGELKEWLIEVSDLAASLAASFRQGPILDDSGMRFLEEQLIDTIAGLKVHVFSRIHHRIFA